MTLRPLTIMFIEPPHAHLGEWHPGSGKEALLIQDAGDLLERLAILFPKLFDFRDQKGVPLLSCCPSSGSRSKCSLLIATLSTLPVVWPSRAELHPL